MLSPIKGRRKIKVYLGRELVMYNTGAILDAPPLLPRGRNYGTEKVSRYDGAGWRRRYGRMAYDMWWRHLQNRAIDRPAKGRGGSCSDFFSGRPRGYRFFLFLSEVHIPSMYFNFNQWLLLTWRESIVNHWCLIEVRRTIFRFLKAKKWKPISSVSTGAPRDQWFGPEQKDQVNERWSWKGDESHMGWRCPPNNWAAAERVQNQIVWQKHEFNWQAICTHRCRKSPNGFWENSR